MGGHLLNRRAAPHLEKGFVARGVKLQKRRAELEALGPFRPAARRVTARDGQYRRAVFRFPGAFETEDLLRGQLEEPLNFWEQPLGRQAGINPDGHRWLEGA